MKKLILIDDTFIFQCEDYSHLEKLLIVFYTDNIAFVDDLEKKLKQVQGLNYEFIFPGSHYFKYVEDFAPRFSDIIRTNTVEAFSRLSFIKPKFKNKYGDLAYYSIPFELNPIQTKVMTHIALYKLIKDIQSKNCCEDFEIYCADRDLRSIFGGSGHITIRDILREYFIFVRKLVAFFYHKYCLFKFKINRSWTIRNKLFLIYFPFVKRVGDRLVSGFLNEKQEQLDQDFCYLGSFVDLPFKEIHNTYRLVASTKNGHLFTSLYSETTVRTYLLLWIKLFYFSLRKLFASHSTYKYESIDLSYYIHKNSFRSFTSGNLIMALCLIETLKKNVICTEVNYLFENYGWERAINFALKTSPRKTSIKAIQSYAFGPKTTNFVYPRNIPSEYCPSGVYVIGEHFKNLLLCMGWPEPIWAQTSSYRYSTLWKQSKNVTPSLSNGNLKKVAVLFNVNRTENLLLNAISKRLFKEDQFEIVYRQHPGYPVHKFLPNEEIQTMKFMNQGTLADVLFSVDIVVCSLGGVGFEALALGKKVFIATSNVSINLASVTSEISSNVVEISMRDILNGELNLKECQSELDHRLIKSFLSYEET